MNILFYNLQLHPYHFDRYNHLTSYSNKNHKLIILEILSRSNKYIVSKENLFLKSELTYKFLNFKPIINSENISILNIFRAIYSIREFNYDIIFIPGYNNLLHIFTLFYSKINRKRTVLISDSKYMDFKRNKYLEYLKGLIIKRFDMYFTAGKRSKDYLLQFGVDNSKIKIGCDVIDESRFYFDRTNYDWPNKIITVARLSAEKNLKRSLIAFKEFTKDIGEKWSWTIVGYGKQMNELQDYINKNSLSVVLMGYKSNKDISSLLKTHSIYFQPSLIEQWGLAINEACASGMPLLLSESCGASDQLLSKNGWKFDPNKVSSIVMALQEMRADKSNWSDKSKISLNNIKKYSINNYSNQIFQIIDNLNN